MKLTKISIITLLALLASACGGGGKETTGTLVNISASGEASRVPDVASISAGVVTEAEDSKKAMRDNAEQMDKLIEAIGKAGIDKKDVQTSGISLSPRYHYQQDRKPQITGYVAQNTVSVKVREIEKLGETLDALAAAGANQIHGPNLEIGEPEPVMAEARQQALDKARTRAEIYAEALGMKVRRIVSVSESGSGMPPRPMMRRMAAEAADMATPVEPGETKMTVNLDLVFELK